MNHTLKIILIWLVVMIIIIGIIVGIFMLRNGLFGGGVKEPGTEGIIIQDHFDALWASSTDPTISCAGDLYNCGDFDNQERAQIMFDRCFSGYGDIHQLDRDGNGVACEGLP